MGFRRKYKLGVINLHVILLALCCGKRTYCNKHFRRFLIETKYVDFCFFFTWGAGYWCMDGWTVRVWRFDRAAGGTLNSNIYAPPRRLQDPMHPAGFHPAATIRSHQQPTTRCGTYLHLPLEQAIHAFQNIPVNLPTNRCAYLQRKVALLS